MKIAKEIYHSLVFKLDYILYSYFPFLKQEKPQEKIKQIPLDKQIKNIMENFNFKEIHKTMKLLNWVWYYSKNIKKVPSIKRIKKIAKRLLGHLSENKKIMYTSTGGFTASIEKREGIKILTLTFVLEEMSGDLEI